MDIILNRKNLKLINRIHIKNNRKVFLLLILSIITFPNNLRITIDQ